MDKFKPKSTYKHKKNTYTEIPLSKSQEDTAEKRKRNNGRSEIVH